MDVAVQDRLRAELPDQGRRLLAGPDDGYPSLRVAVGNGRTIQHRRLYPQGAAPCVDDGNAGMGLPHLEGGMSARRQLDQPAAAL